jgi:hypothetical protein
MVSNEVYTRNITHTYLSIASLDPILIKAVSPKIAAVVICCVRFPAVNAPGRVGARLALRSRNNRRVRLRSAHPATSGESTVMLFPVWTVADRTLSLQCMTSRCGMTPPPTSDAKGGPRVHPGSVKCSNILSKLNSTSDKGFRPSPTNRVSDVKINCARVGLQRVPHNTRRGDEDDSRRQSCTVNLSHDRVRRHGLVEVEVRNIHQFEIRGRQRQSCVDMSSMIKDIPSGCLNMKNVTLRSNGGSGNGITIAGGVR